jgi:hypothetical protein
MSDDLISRQAAIDTYLETVSSLCVDEGDGTLTACARDRDILEMLENLPSVQPKTGRWRDTITAGINETVCSVCLYSGFHHFNYCPYCGAKMEENRK